MDIRSFDLTNNYPIPPRTSSPSNLLPRPLFFHEQAIIPITSPHSPSSTRLPSLSLTYSTSNFQARLPCSKSAPPRDTMAFKRFNARPTSSYATGTPTALVILNLVLRFLQFIFAVAVIGLYAQNISNARKHNDDVQKKWTFAVVVGALAAVTCLVYVVPKLKSYWAFGWDWALL